MGWGWRTEREDPGADRTWAACLTGATRPSVQARASEATNAPRQWGPRLRVPFRLLSVKFVRFAQLRGSG